MKEDKISSLRKKYQIDGLLSDIEYAINNGQNKKEIKKLWNTFCFGIGIKEKCPDIRTLKKYFYQKKSTKDTKQYIRVLEECQEEPRPQSNAVKGDARNDKSKWYKPDLT